MLGFELRTESNTPLSSIYQKYNSSSNSSDIKSEAIVLKERCSEIASLSEDIARISSGGTRKTETLSDDSAEPSEFGNENESIDTSNLRLRLVMFMNEPDTNDMSAWMAWFDCLQGMKQYLETEAGILK